MLEELTLAVEKNEERTVQIEGSGILILKEEPNSAGRETPQNSLDDASNKAVDNRIEGAVNVNALPTSTKRRLTGDIGEHSCTKAYEMRVLPNGKQVSSATECYLTASVHGKCTSSILRYGKRACVMGYMKMEGMMITYCKCA